MRKGRVWLSGLMFMMLMGCQPALTPEQQQQRSDWLQWLAEQNAAAKDPRSSFLNIRDARYLQQDQVVYLDSGVSAAQIRWRDEAGSGDLSLSHQGSYAQLQHQAATARLQPGEEYPLAQGLFITVGRLYDQGLRAFVRDPAHPKVAAFPGYRYFDYQSAARVEAQFSPEPVKPVMFQTIQGLKNRFYRVGTVRFHWGDEPQTMAAYHPTGEPPFEELLFFFKDASNGDTTYGGGRELYLTLPQGTEQPFPMDFNYTVNLYCAHSTFWNCPVLRDPPLAVAIDAGEQLPDGH
ncbi:DUF1684 domain-containing protein [Ferrimonas pelagia]|uniref:DUF1684 domain-containing protein n=1 Tax=Ferrimonas pelagia TaxID=1177826 RepID=A0ABP9EW81_9GAMM